MFEGSLGAGMVPAGLRGGPFPLRGGELLPGDQLLL